MPPGYKMLLGGRLTLSLVKRYPAFQKELKLTKAQLAKLADVEEEFIKTVRALVGLPLEQRRAKIQEMTEECVKKIDAILGQNQKKRNRQLCLQYYLRNTPFVFRCPPLDGQLGITKKQKKQIGFLEDERADELRSVTRDTPVAGRQAAYEKVRDEYKQKILEDVLTKAQRTKLDELAGKLFAFAKPQPPARPAAEPGSGR